MRFKLLKFIYYCSFNKEYCSGLVPVCLLLSSVNPSISFIAWKQLSRVQETRERMLEKPENFTTWMLLLLVRFQVLNKKHRPLIVLNFFLKNYARWGLIKSLKTKFALLHTDHITACYARWFLIEFSTEFSI